METRRGGGSLHQRWGLFSNNKKDFHHLNAVFCLEAAYICVAKSETLLVAFGFAFSQATLAQLVEQLIRNQ
jgi:hypothetical protein